MTTKQKQTSGTLPPWGEEKPAKTKTNSKIPPSLRLADRMCALQADCRGLNLGVELVPVPPSAIAQLIPAVPGCSLYRT